MSNSDNESDPPTDGLPPRGSASRFQPPPALNTNQPISNESLAIHLSYLVATVSAMASDVSRMHDTMLRNGDGLKALRKVVIDHTERLDEHSDLHRKHETSLNHHGARLDEHSDALAEEDDAVTQECDIATGFWKKFGNKSLDHLIHVLVTAALLSILSHLNVPVIKAAMDTADTTAAGKK